MKPHSMIPPLLLALASMTATTQTTAVLQPLPSLDIAPYMGTWYQVLWIPNRFQKQCIADTTATYRDRGSGTLEVTNRCRTGEGTTDTVVGVARPPAGVSRIDAGQLQPARLEVSFLPAWLRWTGIGWGSYWVIDHASDGRYAIVSEASREYLWVLARKPALTSEDDRSIRAKLLALGFNLALLENHPQTPR